MENYGGKLMTTITFNQDEYYALVDLIQQKLDTLCDTIRKDDYNLDEYEKDIRNYTTYDLFAKIKGAQNENTR